MRRPTEKNRQQIFIAGSLNVLIDVRQAKPLGANVCLYACALAHNLFNHWPQLCQSESLTVAENAARCLLSLAEGGTLWLCAPIPCFPSTPRVVSVMSQLHTNPPTSKQRRTSTRSAPWAWVRMHLTPSH
jgi:hypothetical protein